MSSSYSTPSLMVAKSYLESIQRNAHTELGLAIRDAGNAVTLDEAQQYLQTNFEYSKTERWDHAKRIADEDKAEQTSRRDIATYGTSDYSLRILTRRLDELKLACQSTKASNKFGSICFGILPGGGLDAYSEKVPDVDEYVICVPDGFFSLINLACKLAILLLPVRQAPQGLYFPPTASVEQFQRIEHPYVQFRRRDMLRAYFLHGDPYKAQPYSSALPFQDHFAYLLAGTELFVLAHEIAHVALGHFDHRKCLEPSPALELEADSLAFEILNKHFEGQCTYPDVAAIVCADLFLSLNRLWETTITRTTAQQGQDIRVSTHPACGDRIERFISLLKELAGHSSASSYLHVHNAICFATEPLSNAEVETLFPLGNRKRLLSARVLPEHLRHMGHFRPSSDSVWVATIADLLISPKSTEQQLGLWFFLRNAPYVGIEFYRGLLGENESIKKLYERALVSLEPLYEGYLPHLMQLFRNAAQRDKMSSYLLQLSAYLTVIARQELGERRADMDPMQDGFF